MGFAIRIALCCALAVIPLGATPANETALLLARMRVASGPVWRAHLTSTSQLATGGDTTSIESESSGLRFILRRCTGTLCTGTYFDGMRLYSINLNGTALPGRDSGAAYLRGIRTISSDTFLARDFTANGGRIDDSGTAAINGVRYRVLMISNTSAVPMQIFVDPTTSLVRYIRDVNGDGTFEYRDYQRLERGITLPTLVLRNDVVLERYTTRHVVTAPFAQPRGLVATFGAPSVPIATDPNKTVPVFDCTIANVRAHCLLDTGNSGLSMSLAMAERLRAPTVGSLRVAGLGQYMTGVVRAGPLQVGNASFSTANYVVLHDIDRFGYDIVLGADLLAATNVKLDAREHLLQLDASAPSDSISVPLAFDDFVPVIDIQLGEVRAHLAVDTGDESTINLSHTFYQQHPTLFRATEQRSVSGVGGSSVELMGTIPRVTIGDYSTGAERIGTTESLRGTAFGHLGAGFFSQFTVILNYEAGQLNLVPAEPSPQPSRSPHR